MKACREKLLVDILCDPGYTVDIPAIRRFILRICRALHLERGGVVVYFVTNRTIKQYNRRFMHHDYATDVLSFPSTKKTPQLQGKHGDIGGDIMISLDQTWQNARRFQNEYTHELCLYIIHGILHLLGYDDTKPRARKRMIEKQDALYEQYVLPKKIALVWRAS